MDGNHPINFDPRPKRRRIEDNPYELLTVGIETDSPHYYIRFRDGVCVEHCMEISKELFELFDRFELDDLSFLNEVDRHYAKEELNDETFARHSMYIDLVFWYVSDHIPCKIIQHSAPPSGLIMFIDLQKTESFCFLFLYFRSSKESRYFNICIIFKFISSFSYTDSICNLSNFFFYIL